MISKRKYNQLVAALLLVLYAFVTTPVQFWHQHKSNITPVTSKGCQQEKTTLATAPEKNSSDVCAVCDHQFSIYTNDTTSASAATEFIQTALTGCYSYVIPAFPHFNFANKGPPALA